MPEPTTLLMTVDEVAETTRMSIKAIRRATQRGDLQVVRIGRSVRVRPDDLTYFINRQALSVAMKKSPLVAKSESPVLAR